MSYGEIEIIPVLDGYVPEKEIIKDERVKPIYLEKNVGMREAINTGVRAAKGEFIMRTDEHCMFCPNYDKILTETFEDNWIVVPRRYKLDPTTWTITDDSPIDYERLVIKKTDKYEKFSGVEWRERSKERADIDIDETMMMQGSCWIMKKSWWDSVIKELQTEGYGPLYQDTTEMAFKTWKAGGKLMVNKKAWYAHKHRKFNRSHHYPTERAIPEWRYALDKHKDDYKEILKAWGT